MLLSGTLADLDLPSIAAMTSLGRTSLRLELRQSSGDLIGSMVLKAGRVVSATAGGMRGREALRVIMRSGSDTRFQLAQEPLDFALSSALASVDELSHLARGTTGASPIPRLPTDEDDDGDGNERDREGTLSLKPGSRPRSASPERTRIAMMQGRLDEFDLLTLIQTIGLGRQLVEIEIRDRVGMTLGAVRVKSGKLVSARAGSATGIDAVFALSRAAESVQFAAFRIAADPEQLRELASVAEIGLRLNGAAPQPRRPSLSVESRNRRDLVVMEGPLSDFDLPTLLHTVGCSRQYCALEVGDERAVHGTICVKSGIVVSATAGSLTGIPAVQHLIASPRGDRFRLIQLAGELPDQAPLGPVGRVLLHADAPAPARPPAPMPRPPTSTGGPAPSADDRVPTRAEGLPVMEGRLSDFDVRTVLEVLAATRQHARLQIFDPGQPPLGDVTVKAGWILSSQAGALRGKEALTFLLGASPRLQFRVLTLAEGVSAPAMLGPVHEVLGGLSAPRARSPEASTRILRWAIPISFALGGTIIFLVTRGGTTTRAVDLREPPAAQHAPLPPAEPAPPKPAAPAPAAAPPAAPTEAPARPAPGAAPSTAAPSPPAANPPSSEPPSPPAASAPSSEPPPASADEPPASAEPSDDASSPAPGDTPSGRIKTAQTAMKQLGYELGPVDGVYGHQTRSAILRFQRAQHLRPTGMLDPETWSAIVAQLMAHRSKP